MQETTACEGGQIKANAKTVKDCATTNQLCAVENGAAQCKGVPPPG